MLVSSAYLEFGNTYKSIEFIMIFLMIFAGVHVVNYVYLFYIKVGVTLSTPS